MPLFPGDIEFRSTFFYSICFLLAIASHILLRWLYSTQFGLAANAIRDDEDKAEAMGIQTLSYKRISWGIAAFFMGCTGAVVGNMIGFIDKEVAYPIPTFGIFMVAAALLGQGYPMGSRSWSNHFSYYKGCCMDSTIRVPVDRSRCNTHRQYSLFSTRYNGLVAG